MRCKQCDYPLWNLKARTCPECGRPFAPSEFGFVPNSVRFCCPACDQSYYGTGEGGHLVPAEFDCTSCGTHLRMDEMILRPASGVPEKHTRVDVVPWLERAKGSRIKAWLKTIGLGIIAPGRLMGALPSQPRAGAAWGYAALTICAIMFCFAGLAGFVGASLNIGFGSGKDALEMLLVGGMFAGGGVVLFLFALMLWGLATHVLLRIGRGTPHSIGRTYEALCYSIGSNAPIAVPCLGFYLIPVGALWWMANAVIMTIRRHEVSALRGCFAVLAPPVLVGVLATAAGFGGLWHLMSRLPEIMAEAQAEAEMGQAQIQLDAVLEYATEGDGSGPAHMIELLVDDTLSSADFVLTDVVSQVTISTGTSGTHQFESRSETDVADVPLADTTLERFPEIPDDRRGAVMEKILAVLPAGMIAHRVGDYVYTYHGMDLQAADPDLWVLVVSPDPDINSGGYGGDVVVGRADGAVERLDLSFFPAELADQNAVRAAGGLPPLPDPMSVTHSRPATE
jgi:hypothetical protein